MEIKYLFGLIPSMDGGFSFKPKNNFIIIVENIFWKVGWKTEQFKYLPF